MGYKSGSYKFLFPLFIFFAALVLISCEKEEMFNDQSARLVFSSDTILFDTVFSTIGSSTRHFKVYNPYDKNLEISSIILSGGENSSYRINVDGISGHEFVNVLLRKRDSIYIFVETTIDPLKSNSPIIVEDSIVFVTNGNTQDVKLLSWGQDVQVIRGETFETATLTAEKPYLVYDYLLVDTGHVLTLSPGVKMHFASDSRLLVAGTIIVAGNPDNPVVFEGARTEREYRNIPGQWEGIWLMPVSTGNRFVNARIRNAFNGIVVDPGASESDPKLHLAGSRIENMTYAGIFARDAVIYSFNTVINNCGHYALALTRGGDYTFYHTTITNYWRLSPRLLPSVHIENYYYDSSGNRLLSPVTAVFGNSIIHGSQSNELGFHIDQQGGFDVTFDHSLLKTGNNTQIPVKFKNCIFGLPPEFVDPGKYNFELTGDSPALNTGNPDISRLHPLDYNGRARPFGDGPDMGAFERHPED